ncbi:MAG TPA: amino acid adenylation domain-containing protein, partial [Thermomicrobiales bacterium]
LWLLDRLVSERAVYNVPFAVRLTGPLDLAALERAWAALIARHTVLRTRFALDGDLPVQIVEAEVACPLTVVPVHGEDREERRAVADRLAREEAARPFDLAVAPLCRATVYRIDADDHLLAVILHHSVSDGWSIDLLLGELAQRYDAFTHDRPDPLPPLALDYADFAAWQREQIAGAALAPQLAYWRERLRDLPPLLELPTDRPRPTTQTYTGALHRLTLTPERSDELRAFSRGVGATPFTTILAAFKVLLLRYSGQDDLAVGTPVAGRSRAEVEALIGCFVNTVVLRTNLAGDPSFRELLGRVRETTLGAYAHQDVPFEEVVEALQPARDPGYPPLCQVLVAQEVHARGFAAGDLTFGPATTIDNGTAKFDLSLYFADDPAGIRLTFEYNTALFDAATTARLAAQFATLLDGIIAEPGCAIGALPLLPDDQRHELLVAPNATAMPLPQPAVFAPLFETVATRVPDAVAVVCDGSALTYGELNERANRLAHHLRAHGVGPDRLVAICVERSPEMVVALLGVLKAGGAYLPLDPAYPPERLAYMLADSGAAIILAHAQLVAALPPTSAAIVRLDADWPTIAAESAENPGVVVAGEDLAYVIYTSGSTGRPKGVQIPQRALVNFLLSMARTPGLTRDDTLLAVTTLSFDIAALELFLPLIVGARVVIAGREVASDGARLLDLLDRSAATIMQATPATWRLLLAAGWHGSPHLRALCGGEALPRDLAEQILARVGALWNMYGPTETTVWSLALRVESGAGSVPIGDPIGNTRIYLLDRAGQPVPRGVPGELYIGGAGVARGYLGRPDLTAERFVPDPYSATPGARLYRTGDAARYRADGRIEFLGRLDGQVKLRGFRIELGEIEAALTRHPAVRECAVILETGDDPRLVAYLVPMEDTAEAPSVRDLRAFLKGSLPEYMIPAVCTWLDALPLTPNGKVDRRALPAVAAVATASAEPQGPRDDLERQLVAIWEATLGVAPIGVTDNFFDLGGHSLVAVRLFARIEAAFGRKLPLATLFAAPTIGELAALLREQGWVASWSSLVALQPRGNHPPFFCVHAIGGNVLKFRALAAHLGPDQPLYGLQARGLDGQEPPATHVEEMAANYLAEIRQVQPHGPYFLGGQCFGGMVALEMARQVQVAGERVALLAMFDDYAPGYTKLLSRPALVRRR